MPFAYIDGTGLHRATLEEITDSLISSYKGIFGPDIDLTPDSLDGRWVRVVAGTIADNIQTLEQVYDAATPSGAGGVTLSRLVRLSGVTRKAASRSVVTLVFSGSPGTVIPKGTRVASSDDPAKVFATIAAGTIDGGTVSVEARSESFGPIAVPADELTVMLEVITPAVAVTNPADAAPGANEETDAALRARRAVSIALPSQGIVDGVQAALLQLADVTQAVVRENPEDTVQTLEDGGTLAPHAIQAIVLGGLEADVARAVWRHAGPGCTLVGAVTETITDARGTPQVIKFDRPTGVPIYVQVVTTNALTVDQQAAVKEAIVARGNGTLVVNGTPLPGSRIGEDVSVSDVFAAITALAVTTMLGLKVDEIAIDVAPSPTTDDPIAIAFDEIASWDPDNITFAP